VTVNDNRRECVVSRSATVLKYITLLVVLSLSTMAVCADSARETSLESRWVEEMLSEHPLPEYPRPTMVRKEWINLNGTWDFLSNGPKPPAIPSEFPESVRVPFAIQAKASGVDESVIRGWYRKTIEIPQAWAGKKVVLHADGIGTESHIYFNGKEIGTNVGCFKRVSFELPQCTPGKKHEVVIYFDDTDRRMPRGRQKHLSGLWQTAWLEPVPENYVISYRQTPDIDQSQLVLKVNAADAALEVTATALDNGKPVATAKGKVGNSFAIKLSDQKLWSPDNPFLYDLVLELKKDGKTVDRVEGYFGMRKIATGEVDGEPRIFLNNEVYYQTGLLDQGTWLESYLTQPSDKCLEFEIRTARKMGFNVLRKHLKMECERWYSWCDRIGMLVWQDLPTQREYVNKIHENEAAKQLQRDLLRDMVNKLYNHPSIISWVLFNEGGGQFEPRQMTTLTRRLDATRLIDATSAIMARGTDRKRYNADFYDEHCYKRTLELTDYHCHIPATFGEYGGIGYKIEGHTWLEKETWAYGNRAKSADELTEEVGKLVKQAVAMRETDNVCAIIYTQITDFYAEVNGLITFDRKVVKVDPERLRKLNALFRHHSTPE